MNKEMIQKRTQELKAKQQQLVTQANDLKAQYEQTIQQIQMLEGALADCIFWAQAAEQSEPQRMKMADA